MDIWTKSGWNGARTRNVQDVELDFHDGSFYLLLIILLYLYYFYYLSYFNFLPLYEVLGFKYKEWKLNMRQFFSINPDLIRNIGSEANSFVNAGPVMRNAYAASTRWMYILSSDGKVIK